MPPTVLSSPFLTSATPQPGLVVLLLNYTLPSITPLLWKRGSTLQYIAAAKYRICADGGANRLYDAVPVWEPSKDAEAARKEYLPHVIKGDLDSIRPEVANYYAKLGTRITDLSHDQDSTDLQKCLLCAEQWLEKEHMAVDETTILAIGAMGGRLDHTLSNVNTLFTHQHLQLVLCGDGSLARLVPKGHAVIRPNRSVEGPTCGVIALGGEATTSSTGLKWDLDNHKLAVGGLMSSSNAINADEITLTSDQPLLWTTEFKDVATE